MAFSKQDKAKCDKCGELYPHPAHDKYIHPKHSETWAAQRKCFAKPHFHYGAGLHGCLYQDGPHSVSIYKDAVESLAFSYELGRTRKARLRKNGYLELTLERDGNEYCEITECSDSCDEKDYE